MNSHSRHLIFCDESGWESSSRFGCLAMVSGTIQNTKELNVELKSILDSCDKREIHFKEIKNNRTVDIATEFILTSFKYLKASRIKIHVLVWDKHDSRHSIIGRCDIENLKRMYYKNLIVIKRHWNIDTQWEFYPDEFTAINWYDDIIFYLQNSALQKKTTHQSLFEAFEKVTFPTYKNVRELNSKDFAIIQLADLYAGLIRTSRSESEKFFPWYSYKKCTENPTLFDIGQPPLVSNSLAPKFELMYKFKHIADSLRMGIEISETKYFDKNGKTNNLFIWHYKPQGEYDKAPVKRKKS